MTDVRYMAIPTRYAGVEFRSTLEADWACTLDHYGIVWEYEPEGVQLADGTRYRPDFYLPESTTWLEVKGPHDERLDKTQRFADEMWHPAHLLAERGDSPCCHHQKGDPQCHGQWQPTRSDELIPAGDISCCCYGDTPWRFVVVGRPARRGGMAFGVPDGELDAVNFVRCGYCLAHSFFDHLYQWRCRHCGRDGKPWALPEGELWGSGEPDFCVTSFRSEPGFGAHPSTDGRVTIRDRKMLLHDGAVVECVQCCAPAVSLSGPPFRGRHGVAGPLCGSCYETAQADTYRREAEAIGGQR